jgi:hypothetical protein
MIMVMDDKGNRRFERADFNVNGFVTCGSEDCPVSVINISLKGILVSISAGKKVSLKIDQAYPLRISLLHSEISIVTSARLIHREGEKYGFRFDSIEAEGMIHLRRLLELNIGADAEIQKELSFLVD